MVHNGIEYGLMQAYAEGFEIIEHSEFDVDLHELSGIWRYGTVVRSWLLELLHTAFEEHGNKLDDIAPYVEDSGEGRWTIHEAIAENVPAPVIPPRSSPASPRATRSTSPRRSPRRCATSSAVTRSRRWRRPRRIGGSTVALMTQQTTRTRSRRASRSGARRIRARSSSSARPAISRTRS